MLRKEDIKENDIVISDITTSGRVWVRVISVESNRCFTGVVTKAEGERITIQPVGYINTSWSLLAFSKLDDQSNKFVPGDIVKWFNGGNSYFCVKVHECLDCGQFTGNVVESNMESSRPVSTKILTGWVTKSFILASVAIAGENSKFKIGDIVVSNYDAETLILLVTEPYTTKFNGVVLKSTYSHIQIGNYLKESKPEHYDLTTLKINLNQN